LARQVWYHCLDQKVREYGRLLKLFNFTKDYYGLDFGCGSSPMGYELAARGHKIDFVDVDGAGAYEFLKHRLKKNGIRSAGFTFAGPYDYVMMLDSLEHIENWQETLEKIIDALKPNGYIITNYFYNRDFENTEHISMDHEAVKKFLVEHNVYPQNEMLWLKQEDLKNVVNQ
jgi:2-polyprenyl-3-methyl-5-hydroxy-6-metoxy-1,4-benzoquinol methylase